MIELLLNLLWGAVAVTVLGHAIRQRDRRVFAASICAVALLFPIISVSDDMLRVDRTFEDGLSAILAIAAVLFVLVLVARITVVTPAAKEFAFAVHADPRSPPAR